VRVAELAFTDRELDVMAVLWDAGPSTVAEVRERLADPLAYTTVLTILRTLDEKGQVGHAEEGRAYRYHARVERSEAQRSALSRVKRKLFSGSAALLMSELVSDRGLSPEELERIRSLLEDRLDGTEE
jgi:BlaI family penicillinase repressor